MRYLLISVFCLFLGNLYGETVMIYSQNRPQEVDGPSKAVIAQQAAVEDGIMNVLFDDGHIVFNAGITGENESLAIVSDRLSVRLAKNGGAGWLVELDLEYGLIEEARVLKRAEYRLYNMMTDAHIVTADIDVADVRTRDDQKIAELCLLLGEGIGFGILRWLEESPLTNL